MSVEDQQLELKRLKAERKQLRRAFTIAADALKNIFDCDEPSAIADIELANRKFADRAERLFQVDKQVSELIYIVVTDELEIEKEFDETEKYRDIWLNISSKMETVFVPKQSKAETQPDDISFVSSSHRQRNYHLPKLELPKFDGKLKNWIGFWTQFQRINLDETMPKEDKFQYLLQCTVSGSPARELVESFPPSALNYDKAIDGLEKRFGREELLVEFYVRELLQLVLNQATGNKISVRYLYDKLHAQLGALESLGVTSEKYASMLFPLVESALPESLLREWERTRPERDGEENDSNYLTHLLQFLNKEVRTEEKLNLSRSNFHGKGNKIIKESPQKETERIPTAADLVSVKRNISDGCVFCTGTHKSENCYKARQAEPEDVEKMLVEKKACFLCLKKGHFLKSCKFSVNCIICGAKHSPLVCRNRQKRSNQSKQNAKITPNVASTTCASDTGNSCQVLMQTLRVKITGKRDVIVRALIDTGSQRSYLTQKMISLLRCESVLKEKLAHALFGGKETEVKTHKTYIINITDIFNIVSYNINVLDADVICTAVPSVSRGSWFSELQERGIALSDLEGGPIDMLIGADMAGHLFTGNKQVLSNGLVAIETTLGWTIMGRVKDETSNYMVNISLLCNNFSVSELWRLDILGIQDPCQLKSCKEQNNEAIRFFNDTVNVLSNGRYEVRLPWLEGHPSLSRNYELAKIRLEILLKKLRKSGMEKAYEKVLLEWLDENIIEELPAEDWDRGHYLPHRAVFKENSTTKLRPVFDASAHEQGQPSLNQCLTKGVNLIDLIPSMLLRFRLEPIAIIADIKKAFLQISLGIDDRDFLRFLWTDGSGGYRIFRHARVVFGVTSSPFLLGAVINRHLEHCLKQSGLGNNSFSIDVLSKLQRGMYVDNCVVSVSSEGDLHTFIKEASTIFTAAQMELRGWEYSDPSLIEDTMSAVLGIKWNRKTDTLLINIPGYNEKELRQVTRRNLLSAYQKIFDPLGILAPTLLIPKLLIQKTWLNGGKWDDQVEPEIQKSFARWIKELSSLKEISLSRWIMFLGNDKHLVHISLHTFCDASKDAYAAVSYLRVEFEDQVNVHFISAKSRVAPTKNTSIPRLELLAATIGARLCSSILRELGELKYYLWSDSTTVLSWIKRQDAWNVFVFNRVQEIRLTTSQGEWRHVPGCSNPADLASRGCYPSQLMKSRWWYGPVWLFKPEDAWPTWDGSTCEEEIVAERKKTLVTATCKKVTKFDTKCLGKFYKDFYKSTRVVGWIFRFLINKFSDNKTSGDLTIREINRAEEVIWKMIQEESFDGLNDKKLKKLKPFLDNKGIIRLKTKITLRADINDFKFPVVLPSDHSLVMSLIYWVHCRKGHVLGQHLLSYLREKFWILQGRQAIRKAIRECVTCRRFKADHFEVETPPLPLDRIRDARVFEISGTDLAGPLHLKNGTKAWVVIFTCAVYRAVHLELVTSLSTETFMMSFRRFVGRRGRPNTMYSDRGTNLVGMKNLLDAVDWRKVAECNIVEKIEWRLNPPSAPWWGGFWERLIRVLKNILRKVLGKTSLNYEETYTLLTECESLINMRPITYVSEVGEDPIPICPMMFLQELEEIGVPDCDQVDSVSLTKRIRYKQKVREDLRRRFRVEYLGQLLLHQNTSKKLKNTREPVIGEVVIIGHDDKRRIDWPLAIVEKLIKSSDGKSRVVYLRTAHGSLCRPVQRVFPLEIPAQVSPLETPAQVSPLETPAQVSPLGIPAQDSPLFGEQSAGEEEEAFIQEENIPMKTKSGRIVKIPVRYQSI